MAMAGMRFLMGFLQILLGYVEQNMEFLMMLFS